MNCDYSSGASDYKNYKSFTASALSSGAVYLSFLFKAGVNQSQSQSEIFGLATGTNAGAKVWLGKGAVSTSNFRFGTTRGSTNSGDIKWGPTEFSDVNAVIFVVLKYDFSNSTSTLYLNPAINSSSESTSEISDNASATIRTSLNNLWFRLNASNAAKYNIGGVRVSTSWSDAVASTTGGTTTNVENSSIPIFVTANGKSIICSEIGIIQVYNLQGSQVLQAKNTKMLISNLIDGLYIVRFTNNMGHSVVQKIIIH